MAKPSGWYEKTPGTAGVLLDRVEGGPGPEIVDVALRLALVREEGRVSPPGRQSTPSPSLG